MALVLGSVGAGEASDLAAWSAEVEVTRKTILENYSVKVIIMTAVALLIVGTSLLIFACGYYVGLWSAAHSNVNKLGASKDTQTARSTANRKR